MALLRQLTAPAKLPSGEKGLGKGTKWKENKRKRKNGRRSAIRWKVVSWCEREWTPPDTIIRREITKRTPAIITS